jgi:hypothetical protein
MIRSSTQRSVRAFLAPGIFLFSLILLAACGGGTGDIYKIDVP